MVFPIPDEKIKPDKVISNSITNRKRKKKSRARKNKRDAVFNKKHRFVVNMSSWAEQFTVAATWQMKHQLAYWKAKAVSLEYENKILHDIIRSNCSGAPSGSSRSASEFDFRSGPVPKMYSRSSESENSESEGESEPEAESNEQDEGQWEVSEEFVEFLRENAKFKEDARRERERLKGNLVEKNEIDELGAGPPPRENRTAEMKELYGDKWNKIAALEMSIQSHFIQESDRSKPSLWPNIPLNLG